jgi:hypothetical protein
MPGQRTMALNQPLLAGGDSGQLLARRHGALVPTQVRVADFQAAFGMRSDLHRRSSPVAAARHGVSRLRLLVNRPARP